MNKNEHEREKLLAESFHGEWTSGSPATFPQRAAAAVRRRRRVRDTLLVSGAAAGIAVLLLIGLQRAPTPPADAQMAAKPSPAYEIISDDELLAQLKDRPLLVMRGEKGAREFVLLDR